MPTDAGRTRRLAGSETAACLVLTGLVFAAVLAFGASELAVAAGFSALYALFLVGLLASCGWARRDLARLGGWLVPGVLAALLLAAVLWPLTPWTPDGAHPVWSYVPKAFAATTLDRSAVLLNVVNLLGLFCLYVSARVIGASQTRGRRLLFCLLGAMAIYAAGALAQYVSVRGAVRMRATLLGPNSAATVFAATLVMAVAALAARLRRGGARMLRQGDPRAVSLASLSALLLVCLLMTASRGGLVAAVFGVGLFVAWELFSGRGATRKAAVFYALVALLVAGVLVFNGAGLVFERFGMAQQNLDVRAQIVAPHWRAFLAAPWFGYGLGSFPTVNQLVVTQDSLPALYNVRAVHNLYVQWLEEAGVVGAALMAALFLERLAPIGRAALGSDGLSVWSRGAVCAAAVFLVHGFSDFALQAPAIQALAVVGLGVVGGMATGRREARGAPSSRPARLMLAGAVACCLVATGVATPMLAVKLDGDLSAWPTASAEVLASRIERGLSQGAPSREELAKLDGLSDRELALRPGSGSAWLRRAAVDAAAGRDKAAAQALERSYLVAPLQTGLFRARTVFAFERWDRLTPAAREQALYHLGAEWRLRGKPKRFIALANSIRNPAGRVGMALELTALGAQP